MLCGGKVTTDMVSQLLAIKPPGVVKDVYIDEAYLPIPSVLSRLGVRIEDDSIFEDYAIVCLASRTNALAVDVNPPKIVASVSNIITQIKVPTNQKEMRYARTTELPYRVSSIDSSGAGGLVSSTSRATVSSGIEITIQAVRYSADAVRLSGSLTISSTKSADDPRFVFHIPFDTVVSGPEPVMLIKMAGLDASLQATLKQLGASGNITGDELVIMLR